MGDWLTEITFVISLSPESESQWKGKCFSKHYAFDKVDHLIDLQGYMHEVALADFTSYDLSEILNSYEEEQALRAREVNVMKTRWDFMMKNLINSMITEG